MSWATRYLYILMFTNIVLSLWYVLLILHILFSQWSVHFDIYIYFSLWLLCDMYILMLFFLYLRCLPQLQHQVHILPQWTRKMFLNSLEMNIKVYYLELKNNLSCFPAVCFVLDYVDVCFDIFLHMENMALRFCSSYHI